MWSGGEGHVNAARVRATFPMMVSVGLHCLGTLESHLDTPSQGWLSPALRMPGHNASRSAHGGFPSRVRHFQVPVHGHQPHVSLEGTAAPGFLGANGGVYSGDVTFTQAVGLGVQNARES